MKTYNMQAEVDADLDENGNLVVNDDVTFNFDIKIEGNIITRNINAGNIDACNITACNINACNINAGDIDAWNINASNIDAGSINAGNITAWYINAEDISYHAVCIAYESFSCTSIEGRRENSIHKCLDGEMVIRGKTNDPSEGEK